MKLLKLTSDPIECVIFFPKTGLGNLFICTLKILVSGKTKKTFPPPNLGRGGSMDPPNLENVSTLSLYLIFLLVTIQKPLTRHF